MNAWYAHYPGDYGRDTAHLSLVQHGAYRLLLDHYYATAAPLPAQPAALYRICRAFDEAERGAVDFVLSEFFEQQADGYHNARADRELVVRAEHHERLCSGARKTNEKRWGNRSATRLANRSAVARPQPQPQEEKKHPAPSAPSAIEQETQAAAFGVFWEKWPRKQAKGHALRAWQKIPVSEYAAVVAGLEKWRKSDQWARNVIPHPATWLNDKRWKDEDIPAGGINAADHRRTPRQKPSATDLAIQNARALGLGRPN